MPSILLLLMVKRYRYSSRRNDGLKSWGSYRANGGLHCAKGSYNAHSAMRCLSVRGRQRTIAEKQFAADKTASANRMSGVGLVNYSTVYILEMVIKIANFGRIVV